MKFWQRFLFGITIFLIIGISTAFVTQHIMSIGAGVLGSIPAALAVTTAYMLTPGGEKWKIVLT